MFILSMHPTLVLASFLVILPFISATPSPVEPARRDATFLKYYQVNEEGPIYSFNGCRDLSALGNAPPDQPEVLTVENCISSCYTLSSKNLWAGMGNNKCFCGLSNPTSLPIPNEHCQGFTCLGNGEEFCGSGSTLVLYGP